MRISGLVLVLLSAATCYGQPGAPTPQRKPFTKTINLIQQVKALNLPEAQARGRLSQAIGSNMLEWAEYLADPGAQALRPFLSEAEQKRIDKQVGNGAGSSGTTSLLNKVSVPSLIGLAVENGAITQETNGTTIIFRANPAGIINALVHHDYLTSGPTKIILPNTRAQDIRVEENNLWFRILNKASFWASFDTSKGSDAGTFTADRSQLTGYGGHYDIINHRDP